MTPNIIPCFLDWCRAYWEQRLEAAVQAEREACAKVAEKMDESRFYLGRGDMIADKIRARTAQDEGK